MLILDRIILSIINYFDISYLFKSSNLSLKDWEMLGSVFILALIYNFGIYHIVRKIGIKKYYKYEITISIIGVFILTIWGMYNRFSF